MLSTLELSVLGIIFFVFARGLSEFNDYINFIKEYKNTSFTLNKFEIYPYHNYQLSDWSWKCQNGRKFLSCHEMLDLQRIGSCHIYKGEGNKCKGCYYWIDEVGFQHENCYGGNYTFNYYPRQQVFLKKKWLISISLTDHNEKNWVIKENCDYSCKLEKEKEFSKNKFFRFVKDGNQIMDQKFDFHLSNFTRVMEICFWWNIFLLGIGILVI